MAKFINNMNLPVKLQIVLFYCLFWCVVSCSAQKLKITQSTQQTTMPGMGGAKYISYVVSLKQARSIPAEIDSVVSVAGGKRINAGVNTIKVPTRTSTIYEIVFSKTIPMPPCCGRENLPPVPADDIDLSEGVWVYYKVNGKLKKIKISEFKTLANINAP